MKDALCAQIGTELFFPDTGKPAKPARDICARCDVTAECLNFALSNDIAEGVYGGLSPRQRRKLRPPRDDSTCSAGHERTPENTRPSGRCRICASESQRRCRRAG